MKKIYIDRNEFFEKNFIKCPNCGYLNRKEAIAKWGTCLKAKLKFELRERKVLKWK